MPRQKPTRRFHVLPRSLTMLVLIGLIASGSLFRHRGVVGQPAPERASGDTDVRLFGATGDGTTDDGPAIQRAVDAGTGDICFPRGRYRIARPIVVNLDTVGPTSFRGTGASTLLMDGPGPAIRFIGTHGGTADPVTVSDSVWINQRTPMVDSLEIVGQHADSCGIEADGTMQLTITRTVIRKALHGIQLVNRNRNVIISDCHVYENRGAGVFYDNVSLHQSNIIGCHISYNRQGGIVVRGGDVRNIQIGTCDIEGNMGDEDSAPTANVWLDSTGGSIAEVAIVGCTIQHSHDAPDSANIRYNGDSTPRPFTPETRHGHLTIADNVLSDVQVNIDIANARGVTITGNTGWKGYSRNVQVTNCANLVVANNVFERNPRYHYGDGVDAKNALFFEDCDGCSFTGNLIQGATGENAGVEIHRSRRFNITNCSFLDCSPSGLALHNVETSRVSDCLFNDDQPTKTNQLNVVGGHDNRLLDNTAP